MARSIMSARAYVSQRGTEVHQNVTNLATKEISQECSLRIILIVAVRALQKQEMIQSFYPIIFWCGTVAPALINCETIISW